MLVNCTSARHLHSLLIPSLHALQSPMPSLKLLLMADWLDCDIIL